MRDWLKKVIKEAFVEAQEELRAKAIAEERQRVQKQKLEQAKTREELQAWYDSLSEEEKATRLKNHDFKLLEARALLGYPIRFVCEGKDLNDG